ncbi:MAG: ferrochelatase, partial [Proteobacteria bacterium]|nr:ferrochelatase [Pseudomonadota bacterium]
AIATAAGLRDEEWRICYQSRVGRLKWIGPSTDEEIRRAGADGVPVVIYPHAFVSEHVETLVEIEKEFRALAEESGVPGFYRVETLGIDPVFIGGLSRLAKSGLTGVRCSSGAERCRKVCER